MKKPMKNTQVVAVKLSTKNDTNGNPRRLWIVTAIGDGENAPKSERVGIIIEGYEGRSALLKSFPNAIEMQEIEVQPTEYRRWLQVKKSDDAYDAEIDAMTDEELLTELGI